MWVWRKSSYSHGGANSDCVEVGHWRKSSYSEATANSSCVEVGFGPEPTAIRDSKNPEGGTLVLTPAAWSGLRAALT